MNEHDDVNGLSLNVTEFNSLTAVNGEFPLGRDVLRVVAAVVSILSAHVQAYVYLIKQGLNIIIL